MTKLIYILTKSEYNGRPEISLSEILSIMVKNFLVCKFGTRLSN